MAEASSGSPLRPLHLHSRASPQDLPSAPSSASIHSPLTSGSGPSPPGPMSRPSSSIGTPHGPPFPLPPGPGPRTTVYSPQYYPTSNPAGVQLPGYQDLANPHSHYGASDVMANNQIMMGSQGQKRAYRQRRKDPSCDACRERKVKCDATDTSSCTECTSRNVRCQFTKDTNRRMTSMKHNQDLIKELARTRTELDQYKSLASGLKSTPTSSRSSLSDLPGPDPSRLHQHDIPNLPSFGVEPLPHYANNDPESSLSPMDQPPLKRRKTLENLDMKPVGLNILRFGNGIFKTPYQVLAKASSSSKLSHLPSLPPKPIADTLLRQYRFTLHPTIPILHWHYFQKQYDDVYQTASLEDVPPVWIGLLFAVFALGTLHRDWREGQKYMEVSKAQLDLWAEDLTLDHARVALLTSIFLVEMNHKSAGWTWLGIASRIAFDLGLHCEAGTWSAIEAETRRRVWWCIYACDCLLSLQLGRPAMIKEEDCRVELPSPVDDQFIHPGSGWEHPTAEQCVSPLLPTIQIVGGISRLLHLLKSSQLSEQALALYESHYHSCMKALPVKHQIDSTEYLDPIELHPIIYLQSARLMLFRQNMTPLSPPESRHKAIEGCLSVARDTATFLRRCMQEPPQDTTSQVTDQKDSWERRMVSAVSTFFCLHLWRCTLFLCFRLDFASALVCARASAVFGASRPINTACGRYVEFLVREILSKRSSGTNIDEDEGMIAYVSGDLQGNFECSWIWQEKKDGLGTGKSLSREDVPGPHKSAQQDGSINSNEDYPEVEWSGWGNLIRMLEQFAWETTRAPARRISGQTSSVKDFADARASTQSPVSATSQTPSNRISIRDLI